MPQARMPKQGFVPRAAPRRAPQTRAYPPSPEQRPSDLRIGAVDPGITSGMAFRLDGTLYTCVAFSENEVLDLLDKGLDYVVIERFQTGGRLSTYGLATIELVGLIKGYLTALKVPFEVVTPQARYAFMSDAKAMVGTVIEKSDFSQHETDALAHLLSYEYRCSLDARAAKK